jgi:hypothetical protein
MRTRYIIIRVALCLIAMVSAATAFEYRAGDIIYGGGGSIVNHVGLLVTGPDGDLVVHEAQITDGILLTSIEDFTARPYSSIVVIHVDGVSDELAAQAAADVMEKYPPGSVYKNCAAVVEYAYDMIGVHLPPKEVSAIGIPVPAITVPDDILTGYPSQTESFTGAHLPTQEHQYDPQEEPSNPGIPNIVLPDPTIDPYNPPQDPNAPSTPGIHTDPMDPFPADPDDIPAIPDYHLDPSN